MKHFAANFILNEFGNDDASVVAVRAKATKGVDHEQFMWQA